MPRFLLLLLLSVFFSQNASSEDFQFAQHDDALAWKRYEKDTTANAVVLKEYGQGKIIGYEKNALLVYYHVRIKIFNKEGFNQGQVVIPLRLTDNNQFESLKEFKAVTLNRKPDGTVETTELDKKNTYRENRYQYQDVVKFAMPNMKEGCIIEYSYLIESPYIFSFKGWEFQDDIPKVESVFEARIPSVFTYNGVLIGPLKLTSTNSKIDRACMTSGAFSQIDCSVLEYTMRDVPAFIEEKHMTAAKNYKSAIRFELTEYYSYDGIKTNLSKDWKNVDATLKKEESFGKQITRKAQFKDILPEITAGKEAELDKAKAIYTYYQKWFRWNNIYSTYSNNIAKAIKEHTGTTGDINLTLVAALNAAGLDVDAVLLSTRDNGMINKLYPGESDFNYVVAKVNIGTDSYMLDATDPLLPFGMLPIRCINDQGRVMNNKKESYWMDMKASQKTTTIHIFMLALEKDGKVRGTWERQFRGYDAYNKRKEIKTFSTIEEYVENLDEHLHRLKILKSTVENTDNLEAAVSEKYEIEINAFDSLGTANLIYNPLGYCAETNPFKLEERTYPVDMGYPSSKNITVSCTFPEGYKIDGKPEDLKIALPNGGGRFISELITSDKSFIISQLIELNKAVYSPVEYSYLKAFFSKIVQEQGAAMVFKKQM